MRDPWEWNEDDIMALVKNRVPESFNLEFKACAALTNAGWRTELAKDVSAFANSSGGTIVYGIKEDRKTHEAESIDDGYDPAELNKERLEQIINSSIQRQIEGIRYNSIPMTSTRPGKILFVIYIPESSRAPHMAHHRFYRRFECESKYMEEYEVRERYRRETYPGKEIVEAWRDDAINPLISFLEKEELCLRKETWTWNHHYSSFGELDHIGDESQFSANKEDFISRHSEVGDLLKEHDLILTTVNNLGKILFEKVSQSSFIRRVFEETTSEESLQALQAEKPNWFKGTTGSEIFNELFGMDRGEQERFDFFAEWAINGFSPANVETMVAFWRAYHDRFRDLMIYPPLAEYREDVERARASLLEMNQSLITNLKRIRKELSERHNISVEASRQVVDYPYYNPLGLKTGLY